MGRLERLYSRCLKQLKAPVTGGFTLIELLVSMVISSIVITTLLSFMVSTVNNERREQAKAASEQELQIALDYITRDLQQAIYIYDADGIASISSSLPASSTTDRNRAFPVLVFWKREYVEDAVSIPGSTPRDDAFAYSLVAYYLIRNTNNNLTWSNTARIARFQIRDGVRSSNGDFLPAITTGGRAQIPDNGFRLFDLSSSGSTVKDKMNNWTKASADYTVNVVGGTPATVSAAYDVTSVDQMPVLIDFLDQTTIAQTPELDPTATNSVSPRCASANAQQIPRFTGTAGGSIASDNLRTASFYVCVDSDDTAVQIFLRGNAYARLLNRRSIDTAQGRFRRPLQVFFPRASIQQVRGRGLLGGFQ
ncbi:MAG: hormogonium polysaccharide secretion pseudopilin HpsC [Leptolyngbyaceae cyanobacterium bins.59]|nr:hormogonium polysaccharide secretion pseudopilin HpsC [Leptolyngbyaceae cyanobacterium bins.59]